MSLVVMFCYSYRFVTKLITGINMTAHWDRWFVRGFCSIYCTSHFKVLYMNIQDWIVSICIMCHTSYWCSDQYCKKKVHKNSVWVVRMHFQRLTTVWWCQSKSCSCGLPWSCHSLLTVSGHYVTCTVYLYIVFGNSLCTYECGLRYLDGTLLAHGHTSITFYKCTVTFWTQIGRKCLRIKLNGFRSV
jgi:hypothetical protein